MRATIDKAVDDDDLEVVWFSVRVEGDGHDEQVLLSRPVGTVDVEDVLREAARSVVAGSPGRKGTAIGRARLEDGEEAGLEGSMEFDADDLG